MAKRHIPSSGRNTAAALAGLAVALGAPAGARANTVTFLPTGQEQAFMVPAGVTSVHAIAVGGEGGPCANNGGVGGFGALVGGDLPVSSGEVLYIEVGGNGGTNAGFNGGGAAVNGGGSGAGASDVRTVSRSAGTSLATRLLTAAGGGGGGASDPGPGISKGDGGAAGMAGFAVTGEATGGQPGTASGGGSGGEGGCSGGTGGLGSGGAGASSGCFAPAAGGGGGGGLYGGGGGGGSSANAGGGGGSSGFAAGVTNTSVAVDNTGSPAVTLDYTPPSVGGGGTGAGGSGGGTSGGGSGSGGGNSGGGSGGSGGGSHSVGLVGPPTTTPSGVTLKLSCSAPAGQSCQVNITLTITETLSGRRLIAVSAARRPKKRKQTVAVGSTNITISAGGRRSATIVLSRRGRNLLKRFKKLPVTATAKLSSGGKTTETLRRRATIKQKTKRLRR